MAAAVNHVQGVRSDGGQLLGGSERDDAPTGDRDATPVDDRASGVAGHDGCC